LLIGVKRVELGKSMNINELRGEEKWNRFVMFVGMGKKILKKIQK
jgi:hypothetical protein